MKSAMFLILVVMVFVTGCAKDTLEIMGQGTRNDVFRETAEGARIPSGCAELTIVSTLKTHKPGIYPYGNKVRGTPGYALLVNIDGQNDVVKGYLSEENSEPKGLSDPEAGNGIRYLFIKYIMLTAGIHSLQFALPEERVFVKRELTLKDGTTNTLRLEPIYGSINPGGIPGRGCLGSSSFMAGIVGFRVYMNGGRI
jgi:hypothetical protein